jgi:hypothetical protein
MKEVFHHQIKICTWNETAEGFRILANFSNCLEAVDGKHVRVVKSERSVSLCMNYKYSFPLHR